MDEQEETERNREEHGGTRRNMEEQEGTKRKEGYNWIISEIYLSGLVCELKYTYLAEYCMLAQIYLSGSVC
jgi:hypothetical protein